MQMCVAHLYFHGLISPADKTLDGFPLYNVSMLFAELVLKRGAAISSSIEGERPCNVKCDVLSQQTINQTGSGEAWIPIGGASAMKSVE